MKAKRGYQPPDTDWEELRRVCHDRYVLKGATSRALRAELADKHNFRVSDRQLKTRLHGKWGWRKKLVNNDYYAMDAVIEHFGKENVVFHATVLAGKTEGERSTKLIKYPNLIKKQVNRQRTAAASKGRREIRFSYRRARRYLDKQCIHIVLNGEVLPPQRERVTSDTDLSNDDRSSDSEDLSPDPDVPNSMHDHPIGPPSLVTPLSNFSLPLAAQDQGATDQFVDWTTAQIPFEKQQITPRAHDFHHVNVLPLQENASPYSHTVPPVPDIGDGVIDLGAQLEAMVLASSADEVQWSWQKILGKRIRDWYSQYDTDATHRRLVELAAYYIQQSFVHDSLDEENHPDRVAARNNLSTALQTNHGQLLPALWWIAIVVGSHNLTRYDRRYHNQNAVLIGFYEDVLQCFDSSSNPDTKQFKPVFEAALLFNTEQEGGGNAFSEMEARTRLETNLIQTIDRLRNQGQQGTGNFVMTEAILAWYYQFAKRPKEALEILNKDCLRRASQILGRKHLVVINLRVLVARCYGQTPSNESHDSIVDALGLLQGCAKPHESYRQGLRRQLADSLLERNEVDNALNILHEVYTFRCETLGYLAQATHVAESRLCGELKRHDCKDIADRIDEEFKHQLGIAWSKLVSSDTRTHHEYKRTGKVAFLSSIDQHDTFGVSSTD